MIVESCRERAQERLTDGLTRFRGAELERALAGVQEDRRLREIRRHTRTQSQFLRLRRTRIGLRDFRTVKVIGKGAFGEVSVPVPLF